MPASPPKEIFTSPPAWRIFVISGSCHWVRGSKAPNQLALHALPPAMMNASVKLFRVLAFDTVDSSGVGY